MYTNATDPQVIKRQKIEVRILKAVINEALKQGYAISVEDGEERFPATTDKAAILDAAFNTDEDHLYFVKPTSTNWYTVGWVYLVYGNDGWDVICDYTDNEITNSILGPANKLAESLA